MRAVSAKCLRGFVLLSLFLFSSLMALRAQSLADLAKEEKERRAQIKSKSRVISNQTIDSYKKGSVSTGVYGESAEAEKKKSTEELKDPQVKKVEEPVKDEGYWRIRYKTAMDEIQAAENRSVLEQLNLTNLWNQFYRESDGFYRETIRKKISEKEVEIKKLKAAEEEAKRGLEKLKQEARSESVPPGWLR